MNYFTVLQEAFSIFTVVLRMQAAFYKVETVKSCAGTADIVEDDVY